jgi:hypothetical protein
MGRWLPDHFRERPEISHEGGAAGANRSQFEDAQVLAMTWRRILVLGLVGIPALLLALWLARARLAAELARNYFRSHGIASTVSIDALGFSGVSGRFALGPADAPALSADRIELHFDPLRWAPRVVEVRLVHPVVRAQLAADGALSLPSLQPWIDSLRSSQGQSRFVSSDLAVSLTGLNVFLTSPYGALTLDGDVKLVRNEPVLANLFLRPAAIRYGASDVTLKTARLSFAKEGGRAQFHVEGDVHNPAGNLEGLRADLSADGLRWAIAKNGFALSAPSLRLTASSARADIGLSANAPSLALTARNVRLSTAQGGWDGDGDLQATATAGFESAPVRALLASDRTLAAAAAGNLAHLDFAAAGHVKVRRNKAEFSLAAPAVLRGAAGGVLNLSRLNLHGGRDGLGGALEVALTGRGLPALKLSMPDFGWANGAFQAQARIEARLDYAAFRGIALAGSGHVQGKAGVWAYFANDCARLSVAAFHPGAADMAKSVAASLCPLPGKALAAFGAEGLALDAIARNAKADLPIANAHLDDAQAALHFSAGAKAPLAGTVALTSARMSDKAASLRFHPLLGSGTIELKENVWRGRIVATDEKHAPLGTADFRHVMASGAGSAHIAAPHLVFAPGKLQPENLSPLLAAFRNADGAVDFSGEVRWTQSGITSGGHLAVASLDFLTPLGKAHAVKTQLDFTSLLPPATKPGQALAISRIDWTLPFSAVDVRFGFSPTAIKIDKVDSGFAEGHAALGAFTVNLANPGRIDGAADLASISLSSLVTASNLGSKVKLEGKVSGHVPFSAGPDGFRIVNGHVEADGPGHLSIDRSLWTQGAGATATNAVQDFAYQALEHLAFDQLSADLNSVAGGRLQVVFHIKGRSDPPQPQQAQVGLIDLVNGTALQKPIPLPNGTPIDLTLDTSLNFDELLKSYGEAWSKTLQGQTD